MNALFQYQDKLEEQFLNTIESVNFEDICHSHIEFFKQHIQTNFNYSNFSVRTARAKNPLQQFDDLVSYIALYGLAHYQRFHALIDHIKIMQHFDASQPIQACIVDYGCGQGIATLAFMDHLIESKHLIKHLKVILIEPSVCALKRAIHWIQKKAKAADITVEIVTFACTFDELDNNYLASNIENFSCFHLFNNILDMYSAGKFSLATLAQKMKSQQNLNYIFAISPNLR